MSLDVFITGRGDTAGFSPHVPATPKEIAAACVLTAMGADAIGPAVARDFLDLRSPA